MKRNKTTVKDVHRLHDGELDDTRREMVQEALSNDPTLESEVEWLEKIGKGLRHDTEEALRSLDEDALAAEIEQRLSEEKTTPTLSSWQQRFSNLWKPVSVAVAAAALALVVGLHYQHRQSDSSWEPNNVIVQNLNTFESEARVFETQIDGENEPVKVIWLFEENMN